MEVIARVFGVSLIAAVGGVALGYALCVQAPDWKLVSLLVGCVGALIGALAGATRETVRALRQKPLL